MPSRQNNAPLGLCSNHGEFVLCTLPPPVAQRHCRRIILLAALILCAGHLLGCGWARVGVEGARVGEGWLLDRFPGGQTRFVVKQNITQKRVTIAKYALQV